MKKHIPNIITLSASLCGVVATTLALEEKIQWAALFILFATILDFSDGFFARLLKAYSDLGADLDSLSDVVSFGVAPSAIAYKLLEQQLSFDFHLFAYIAFLIVPFSVLRLAIFNNATNQKTSFVGLPVPAHAMLWVGLVFLQDITYSWIPFLFHPLVLAVFVLLFSLLLVSKLSLFSLKINIKKSLQLPLLLLLFLAATLVLLLTFGLGGLFFIILLYILTGFLPKHSGNS